MKRKDIIKYISMIALIIAASVVTPRMIRAVSDYIVVRIEEGAAKEKTDRDQTKAGKQSESETETITGDTDDGPDFLPTEAVTEQTDEDARSNTDSSVVSERDEEAMEKIKTDQALAAYEASQHPSVTSEKNSLYEIFIGDREKAFTDAIADFLFSVYGDRLTIEEIRVVDFIDENDQEVTCQIYLTVSYKGERESGYYLARYNTDYDFYSIYAYRE